VFVDTDWDIISEAAFSNLFVPLHQESLELFAHLARYVKPIFINYLTMNPANCPVH